MKKKIFLSIIIIVLLVGVYLIFKDPHTNKILEVRRTLENVTMIIKEGTLTNKGATIIIKDLNEEKCLFGRAYHLEKYNDGKWEALKSKIDMIFTLEGLSVGENNELSFDLKWENYYGELNPGKYRIVKTGSPKKNGEYLEDRYVYTEFSIKDTNNLSLEEKLYQKVNPSEDYALLKYLYTNNNSFDNNYIIAVGLNNYIDKNNNVEVIKEEDVNESIKEIFGADIKFNHQNTYIYKENYCSFEFDEAKKEYIAIHGCDGDMFHKLYRKVITTKELDKTLEIYEKLIFAEWSQNFDTITIYNNNIDKKVIEKLDGNKNIDINNYLDNATTYKYTFEKVNNNYIFKSLTKVK